MKSLRQTAATRPGDSRTRVPVEEVAARGRVSVATIRYRVAHREMSGLDRAGLFDLTRALRELARKPRQRGGRKAGPITPSPVPVRPGRDAATRFRSARAGQEELRLAKLQGRVERVATFAPRTFHLIRGDRDRLLAWVSRTAPLIAAEVRVDEGNLWRAIERAVCAFLSDLATLAVDTGDEDEKAPTPGCGRTRRVMLKSCGEVPPVLRT